MSVPYVCPIVIMYVRAFERIRFFFSWTGLLCFSKRSGEKARLNSLGASSPTYYVHIKGLWQGRSLSLPFATTLGLHAHRSWNIFQLLNFLSLKSRDYCHSVTSWLINLQVASCFKNHLLSHSAGNNFIYLFIQKLFERNYFLQK